MIIQCYYFAFSESCIVTRTLEKDQKDAHLSHWKRIVLAARHPIDATDILYAASTEITS
jgi:hypothetical protein